MITHLRHAIIRLASRKPLIVEHVRYVKQPAVDPVAKAIAMAKAMGRNDLVERLEG